MKKRRYLKLFVSILAIVMMLTGCGSASMSDMAMNTTAVKQESSAEIYYETGFDSAVMEETADTEMPPETQGPGEMTEESNAALSDRKLITTVSMDVETKEFDSLLTTLESRVAELGGYIESMETYNGSTYSGYRSSRNASMTLRIPQNKLENFLNEVSGICNVVRQNRDVEDVTLTYVDLESHKKVLEAEQDRLLELIEKAETIEDIITIENRLSDVRYQLESMESQLRTFDNKINYSTIYLNIDEVQELTPIVEQTVLEQIAAGFKESLEEIADGFKELVIWFVINIPYFVLWAVLLVIVILAIRWLDKVLKKRRTKKEAKAIEKKAQEDAIK